ncbi:hypothetical protein AK812_SmicGene28747 [Symbiodinium microadriaticum]|uniref:Uncharacterized protein n=1 Tax=Symbiodinium microadriaticum TaxID=2951 RepID=A0A1Q9D3K5_SYMMI|nr:hypothetical protein AK812_SmicGene28747 [Symbiodinium microadriaticum]CAE7689529.1 unnamed protein product [Symbiodinium microadriaticum]CAE7856387.1 unnamed protein product [Symbiodinium sp. KB8]
MASFRPVEGSEFTAISDTPGQKRGRAYEAEIRQRLRCESPEQNRTFQLPQAKSLSQEDKEYLSSLHEKLYNLTHFSVGQPLLEKIYDNSRQDHDTFREASCDAIVGHDVDIVSMLKEQAYPFYGGSTWKTGKRIAILEVSFSCALVWLKVYQLERCLMIATAAGQLDLASCAAGVVINGQPLTCDWKTGLEQFRPDGPVRQLVEQGRFHMVHLPLARVQEVDRIHADYRGQLNRLYRVIGLLLVLLALLLVWLAYLQFFRLDPVSLPEREL